MIIIQGDCLEEMRKMEPNSISAIVTDPPYGLSFMGKGWDHAIPNRTIWAECLRIMVPGAFLLAMGGTRTFHRLTCEIEDAGYEIRDCISWLYGSGFPKSHNHYGIQGYGTALKPAWEPIIMAMKPCDGTFKQNAEKWGQAGINIDGCRIGSHEYSQEEWSKKGLARQSGIAYGNHKPSYSAVPKGRWPANVMFDEEGARMLDEQSGFSNSPISTSRGKRRSNFGMGEQFGVPCYGDSGGASRFFYCAKASSSERNEGLDLLPIGQSVGGGGTNNTQDDVCGKYGSIKAPQKNYHPTVKPLKLMEYLIKLVMPPKDGILFDPFAGSGTTILAARKLGYTAIGIEKEQQYCEIARARIEALNKKEETRRMELFTA